MCGVAIRPTLGDMTTTTTDIAPTGAPVDLRGRTAIVTGGAMGIGWGIARRLHEAGADLVIADIDTDAGQQAAEALRSRRPQSAIWTPTDVSDATSVEAMMDAAVDAFGGLDILVNNAGIYPMLPLSALDQDTFRHVIDVNLTGLFLCIKLAADRMIERGRGGRIINITSIDALHPSMIGLAAYDASKHGAWGLTKNVALELAPHGITVNAVAPGGIATPGTGMTDPQQMKAFETLIPMHRMGDPDDIGKAVLFLASDLCSYMTGAQIVVDGGRLLA